MHPALSVYVSKDVNAVHCWVNMHFTLCVKVYGSVCGDKYMHVCVHKQGQLVFVHNNIFAHTGMLGHVQTCWYMYLFRGMDKCACAHVHVYNVCAGIIMDHVHP